MRSHEPSGALGGSVDASNLEGAQVAWAEGRASGRWQPKPHRACGTWHRVESLAYHQENLLRILHDCEQATRLDRPAVHSEHFHAIRSDSGRVSFGRSAPIGAPGLWKRTDVPPKHFASCAFDIPKAMAWGVCVVASVFQTRST